MKTRKELEAEYPEIFAEINKEISDKTTQVESLNKTISEKDTQIATLNETVTNKDNEIKSLNDKVTELNSKVETFEKAAKDAEEKATKEAKENAISQILQKDTEYAKVASLVKKFEVCQNAAEVQTVYEANRELLNEMKKSFNVQPPETKVEEKKEDPKPKMTEAQRKEFIRINEERLGVNLKAYSEEDFLKRYSK